MTKRPLDLVALGECMAEFTMTGGKPFPTGFAGDALNTAVYASRQGMRAGFISAIGDDKVAQAMRAFWKKESIDVACPRTVRGGRTGSYFIATDAHGERTLTYDRAGSAASKTLRVISTKDIIDAALRARIFYFTGVTMAAMKSRQQLLKILRALHGHVAIAFDCNYRALLWPSRRAYRDAVRVVAPFCTYLFLSREDYEALGTTVTTARMIAHYAAHGTTCILKDGKRGALYFDGHRVRRAPAPQVRAIDTTGAGDAFNAGVLAGIKEHEPVKKAVARGVHLASSVVQHHGAIVHRAVR